MISLLEGTVEFCDDRHAVLSANGVGYTLHCAPKMLGSLPKDGSKVKVFVHSQLNMREGSFDLYGFASREDLQLFGLLTSVSGIGPKGAMGILSSVEPKHLKAAIVNDDADYLCKLSTIGPKTAKRLILELKNKVDHIDMGNLAGVDLGEESQAMDALVLLGYSPSQAKEALKEVPPTLKDARDRVREALKLLGKR